MVIVGINATYGIGSTGHIVSDIHNAAKTQGHKSFVFCAMAPKRAGGEIIKIGSVLDHKLHAFAWRLWHNQGFNSVIPTKALCKKLSKIKPDIVHLHNLHSNYINLPILLDFLSQNNIATVITLHDCWFFTGQCMHFLNYDNCSKWKAQGCEGCQALKNSNTASRLYKIKKEKLSSLKRLGVIGVSDWITGCGAESFLRENASFKRIYNWIDCSVFSPKDNKKEIKKKYGLKEDKKLILGVSQGWSDNKGLKEFKMLSEDLADMAQVVLVGQKGENRSSENLKFIGYTSSAEELAELYSAADVFVNPSRMETFGKVTAEALSCGTPVVAYSNTGTREIVTDKTGVLVADGDAKALLQAVERLLSEENGEREEACRQFATENFNKSKLIKEHFDFYKELTDKNQE